jgi:hypothetical protein
MSIKVITCIFKRDLTTATRKLVALKLGDVANDDGTSIYPSVATVARETGLCERVVRKVLAEFRSEGLIHIVKQGGGRNQPTEYRIDLRVLEKLAAAGAEQSPENQYVNAQNPAPQSPFKGRRNPAPDSRNPAPDSRNPAPDSRNPAPDAANPSLPVITRHVPVNGGASAPATVSCLHVCNTEAEPVRGMHGSDPEDYAFAGHVIRLKQEQLDRWKHAYHAIPDIEAELTKADDYYTTNPPADSKWFFPVSRWLERAHTEHLKAGRENDPYRGAI